ncbi:MAG: hypothetical protein J0I68_02600 [Achromobacter sp.]|jgi:hypothetical protein|uniref:Uncharacterized protein n=1 Tax=Achromobacter insuavis TaxID=1287735 RepID=A0A6J5B6V7_9BURK|nr:MULTISPECIES: CrpP-related protein [Achromobacter]MBN9637392.1 hypothetical protein [Achromobacter sp.]CAB3693737.1 hypothetical protein LMG26845_04883 [Achromobacter insuavis]CAB3844859.1 hypothetical protein LMG26846_01671 [Achromobacter insuavis]CUI35813.1 Uncharacterised protein [Achromobacter sp. 2789STDY5608621]CUI88935.1 Uncharacterised protein [Achromobacter sp. 2789STDY5608628]
MYDDIRRQGSSAAEQGAVKLDCPYFRLELMPTWTREPLTQWLAKVRAWEAGWQDQQHSRARM